MKAHFAVWGDNEENLLQAMKKTRDHAVLAPLSEKLEAPNAIHLWREVRSDLENNRTITRQRAISSLAYGHCAIQSRKHMVVPGAIHCLKSKTTSELFLIISG